jgi:YYY domain-containing protein
LSDFLSALYWYLAIMVIGVVSFPIAFRFLSRLPGKGYAFSKPLGLLLWGYIFWMFGELGVIQNNIGGELLALLVVLAASGLALRNGKAAELVKWLKDNWKTVLAVELIFLLFFAVWAWVRSTNPEIVGTEKPMEQAFINAILNSPTFPPRDPWLSGYAISYYYFGYVLIAMLTRITGVLTGVGYNLTSASWFGLTAAAAFGMVADLIAFWARGKAENSGEGFKETHKSLGRWSGLLGSLFILIVSNLEGLLEVLHARGLFWKINADGTMTSRFWSWLDILELNQVPIQPLQWQPTRYLVWWRGSRVLHDLNTMGGSIEIIDEFPFFSYLLSDLHPHVLAMPFDLLAMAMCLNLFIGASENHWPTWKPLDWLKTWEFWLTALVLGSMAFFNTWDFPIYVGLFCLVLIYLRVKQSGWCARRLWEFIKFGLTLGVSGVLLFLPFFLGFKSQAGGLLPSLDFITRGAHFWVMFAPLMIPIFLWLFHTWRKTENKGKGMRGWSFAVILIGSLWLISSLFGALIFAGGTLGASFAASANLRLVALGNKLTYAAGLFSGVHGTSDGAAVLLSSLTRRIASPGTWVTLTIMLALVWGLITSGIRRKEDVFEESSLRNQEAAKSLNANGFMLFIVLIGIALSGFPEFFYLRDDFGTRMNTIFKFYFQTWMFWGIAAAYASVVLWRELKKWKNVLFSILWIVVFVSALVYPAVSLNYKMDLHFENKEVAKAEIASWTLDGNAYMRLYYADEAEAVAWLTNAPDGIIAEAIGGSYSEYGRMSELTGKQTVLMWPGHEMQWRGGTVEMGSRETDIATLYESAYWFKAEEIIQEYNIRYVILGNFERDAYHVNKVKFDNHLTVVFQNKTVIIYEVPVSVLNGEE